VASVTPKVDTTGHVFRRDQLPGRQRLHRGAAREIGPVLPVEAVVVNRQPMTVNGIGQMVRRRGVEAGIPELHPHVLAEGGNEGDLVRITGWKAGSTVNRYRGSAAGERLATISGAWRLATGSELGLAEVQGRGLRR
jgi:hypothetical protein